jgi:conserved domain protein
MAKTDCPNRIRVVLAEKEVTGHWLATQMGVTDITVSRWKTNKIQPSMAQYVEIARLLQVNVSDLVDADLDYQAK